MAGKGHRDQMRTAGGGSGSSGMWEVKDAGGAGGGLLTRLSLRPRSMSTTMKLKAAWQWLPC